MRYPLQYRLISWLGIVCLLLAVSIVQAGNKGPPPDNKNVLRVELFPFVGTSFVEIFPEDFTDEDSPLFGETQEEFLDRIRSTFPFVFPNPADPVNQPTGFNMTAEPVAVEHEGRLVVRVEALGMLDGISVPGRFNGVLDTEEAIRELDYFSDRLLVDNCGVPQSEHPLHYVNNSASSENRSSLTTLTGLDINGTPDDCPFVNDPDTHVDESLACDAENIPGPDNAADVTREQWSPRSFVGDVTLGRFLKARGTVLIRDRKDDLGLDIASVDLKATGLLSGAVYTVFDVQTDPLGRPLPAGFPTGGAPANTVLPDRYGKVHFNADLITNPIGHDIGSHFPLPESATITMLLVWQANGQTNGGIDSTIHTGGGLPGG